MPNNWIFQNLQKWSPFSVIAIMIVVTCLFIVAWNSIHNIPIPGFIYAILSILAGGTGATAAISHGVVVANGVAKDTAKSVVDATVKAGGFNTINTTEER